MIKETILSCALALPSPSFIDPLSARAFIQEYRFIESFLKSMRPHAKFLFIPNEIHKVPKGYRKELIEWRNHAIYYRENA